MKCQSRYHLNNAVKCWKEDAHKTHEGMYALAGQVVTWTDADRPPEPPVPSPAPTAMEEAFRRAGLT